MPRQNVPLLAFNRGIISPKGLARIDLDRVRLSAEEQTNWMPRSLGSMTIRSGMGYLGSTLNDNPAYFVPFVFSTTDTSLIEFTQNKMRVWTGDTIVSRPAVTASISNGGFDTDLSGWTDADELGATSTWVTGGYMSLTGTGTNRAIRRQEVTVNESGTEHSLSLSIERGPVTVKIGSTSGASDLLDFSAREGSHSITFTPPSSSFWIEFSSPLLRSVLVSSVAVGASGALELDTPFGADDIVNIRHAQSVDVIFIACAGFPQRRIERRSNNSWSLVAYDPQDGPFDIVNTTRTTITPSAINGNITLTASDDLFVSEHVGALFRLDTVGQTVESPAITEDNTFTDDIRVTGVGNGRAFAVTVAGTFAATVTLQRSISAPGNWEDVESYTTPQVISFNDNLDNQIIHYRIGVKTGDYTSGTVGASLAYGGGTSTGVVRITDFTSATSVGAEVLEDLGSINATDLWYEGLWSDRLGYPTAATLFEGRLWWAGRNRFYGSVSDEYESFDNNVEGDSGPIIRVIGFGPADNINWILSLQRIIAGTAGSEITVRSSSFDEPLTPTVFNMRDSSTQGGAPIDAVRIDNRGLFVQRTGNRVIEMAFDGAISEYQPLDLMLLVPDIADSGIKRLGVQRQPDTRLHVVLNNGDALVYVNDQAEAVKAWIKVQTSGNIEDVVVLPGNEEDAVYYVVNRNGNRYLERWALESECIGGDICKLADSFIQTTGQVITGLSHLEGSEVVVWADGRDLGTFTVSSGQISLDASYTNVIVGLKYTATYKSSKLAYAAGMGTALTQRKRVTELGLVMMNVHANGVMYGTDPDRLDALPREEGGEIVDADFVWPMLDAPSFAINGSFTSDQRLYLQAEAPRPCTVLAAIPTIVTYDKS